MQILLNKGHHRMMVTSKTNEVSMISWVPSRSVTDKFITGVRTELMDGEKSARVFLRKFVKVLTSNGYEISFEKK